MTIWLVPRPFNAQTAVIAAAKSWLPNSKRFKRQQTEAEHTQSALIVDEFAAKTLLRVRVQLDLINEALTVQLAKPTLDAQAIDRLASAQRRLSEQERILAGRPLPGSFRPMQERSGRNKGRAVEVWSDAAIQSSPLPSTVQETATTPHVGPENG